MNAQSEARLVRYRQKRDFAITPEPEPALTKDSAEFSFVIQKHAATRLHYDFRLELDGVLVSWAVPKGPSYDSTQKRMAVRVEDHPVAYASFEGTIPPKQYGAGSVIVWDRGTWEPVGDPRLGLADGKLVFRLHGEKLAGLWELVRIRKPGEERQDPWLLFKKKDEWTRPLSEYDIVTAQPDSVIAKPLGLLEARSALQGAPSLRATAGEHTGNAPGLAPSLPPVRPAHGSRSSLGIPGPEALAGAIQAVLPSRLRPQLATLAQTIPAAGTWSYEIKFDGYRLLAHIDHGEVRLVTRGGHDWTAKMKSLAAAVAGLGLQSGWLDGEIVVMNGAGAPDFNALQNAFDAQRTERIVYFIFDVPYFEGYDMRQVPLQARRALLKDVLDAHPDDRVRYSADFAGDAASVLDTACRLNLEGIIAKRIDAPYVSQRNQSWLKLKCAQRQEFVIGGFTGRTGANGEIGSLLLGVYGEAGKLTYAGNVGTGWDAKAGRDLYKKVVELEVAQSPFEVGDPSARGRWTRRSAVAERWIRPELVAEIAFAEWTPDGSVRHASFHGLRLDKPATTVKRERAPDPAPAKPLARKGTKAGGAMQISNPERVIDPSTGLKKLDLVRYYDSVADWILPHLKGRPVSLVRGPTGVGGELFFQKHGDKLGIPGIRELDPALWPGHQALLEIGTTQALVGAAQMNMIELHTWNSTATQIDRPNRMIFDLDPGEGVNWAQVLEAAMLTRTILTELGLQAWLKTSGGKGLHIVVPLLPRLDYDSVNAFSKAVVVHLAKTIPSRFVAKSGAANRKGKIFVDYLRNGHGATTAVAYSARARPGLGVSMPVAWEQLPTLKGGAQWTIATAREHLSFQKIDPWADYSSTRQTLTAAIKRLG